MTWCMNTQNRMVSLDDQSNKSSQSSRLSVSSVSVEDASEEEGPPDDDDSVFVAIGLYSFFRSLVNSTCRFVVFPPEFDSSVRWKCSKRWAFHLNFEKIWATSLSGALIQAEPAILWMYSGLLSGALASCLDQRHHFLLLVSLSIERSFDHEVK